jgi:hypothetical protein
MTQALGDCYPQMRHQADFARYVLTPGHYLIGSATDGFSDIHKAYRGPSEDLIKLAEVLKATCFEKAGIGYAQALSKAASERGSTDDISFGVLKYTVPASDDMIQFIFALDGHGSHGHLIADLVKYVLETFLILFMEYVQAPGVEQQKKIIDTIQGEAFRDHLLKCVGVKKEVIDEVIKIFYDVMLAVTFVIGASESATFLAARVAAAEEGTGAAASGGAECQR